jgi:hypothetical protein
MRRLRSVVGIMSARRNGERGVFLPTRATQFEWPSFIIMTDLPLPLSELFCTTHLVLNALVDDLGAFFGR